MGKAWRARTLVHFRAAVRRARCLDHKSPTMTSTAWVAANRVRSSVRPANFFRLPASRSACAAAAEVESLRGKPCFDCSSRRLNHAATNDPSHLAILMSTLVSPALGGLGFLPNPNYCIAYLKRAVSPSPAATRAMMRFKGSWSRGLASQQMPSQRARVCLSSVVEFTLRRNRRVGVAPSGRTRR